MKQTFHTQQNLKQNLVFHPALYDALDILKLSSYDLMESIYNALLENPLLDIEYNPSSTDISINDWNTFSTKENLKDNLYMQLHTCKQKYDEKICSYIIESLDDNGFFREKLQDTATLLATSEKKVVRQLRLIQSFEPIGVAATSPMDALIIQAKHRNENILAALLENPHDLLKEKPKSLAKKLKCNLSDINHAYRVLKELEPYPCSSFSAEKTFNILPDVNILVEDGQILVNPITHFQLHYNDCYMDLIKTNPVLKSYFEKSKLLLSNISKRNATMMLVFHEIINTQASYFLYQDELRPLKQIDIAKKLGIHQATVSRAVMNKYFQFENEIYPISGLFTSVTNHGDSSDAIKKAIRDIIDNEDKNAPLSDQQIVESLYAYDYSVSRRTVTKYREAYHIPNARNRKVKK